ncbi:DUF29 domain-containing protein [Chroococcus sp. FPU101]|uniref:DUF29 domain-containing protein n=1 Tax=Chroococcus sp. FPU101 TaxID=1974212 RepID=UPI001A8FD6EC|nr:DUF29 domain-containing protein [Chroococcus sp. FPU101]GFE70037.1 hypothetical protein CFPU101_26470 [Chroococcus sp. FPU101]
MSQPIPLNSLYETDFYAWTQKQAELLRHQKWSELDLPNLVEEIESLGKQQRSELRNRLSILVGHLLKWEYQPQKRTRSWFSTIRVQRIDILELLAENPSLKPYLSEGLKQAYQKGVILAAGETNLSERTFQKECPYTIEQVLDEHFFPGESCDWLD